MGVRLETVIGCEGSKEVTELLSWATIVEIAIHIGPTERPFNWIDLTILVAIEFLEMVVGQFRIVRVWNSCTKMIPTGIIALRAFQHAVIHEVGSRLHDGFRHLLPMNFHMARAPWICRLDLGRYRLSLLLNSLRLALRYSGNGALLGTLHRRVFPLLGLLLGGLSCDDDRSRLLCFIGCRNRLPDRSYKYGHGTDYSECNKR
jgi:hypothetical protein